MSESNFLLLVTEIKSPSGNYSIEEAAQLAGFSPESLLYYCRLGLFGEARKQIEFELRFDDDDVYELRRFKHFRDTHGVKTKTLRLILELWRDLDSLRAELRFLRSRS